MSKSTTVKSQSRKKPGPPATGKGTPVLVRLQPDMLAALDKFVDRDAIPSRPEAVRLILKEWLMENQMLPAVQEGTRPEDLNASNDD